MKIDAEVGTGVVCGWEGAVVCLYDFTMQSCSFPDNVSHKLWEDAIRLFGWD